MATSRKTATPAVAAPAQRVTPVKPSAKLAATPAGKKNAAEAAKRKTPKAANGKGKPGAAGAPKTKVKAPKDTKPAKGSGAAKAGKSAKAKVKFPKAEYGVLDALKQRAVKAGLAVKKGELLRAGLKALAALPDLAFRSALDALPARKPRRPTKA